MKEISKAQVIDLMNVLNRDGVDNSHCDINTFTSETDPHTYYGADEDDKLEPGKYCAVWFDEDDYSDFPNVLNWINENLTEENVALLECEESSIILICLDLL